MALETPIQRAQVRRTADFHPSVWGDYFINRTSNDETVTAWSKQVELLKEEVRRMLKGSIDEPSKMLDMVDAIQRLGISYHFEGEIEGALEQIYNNHQLGNDHGDDLYSASLQFRLLRQHGYNISSDVFNRFVDTNGDFKKDLISDAKGMLSLYEASYLSVQGEDVLDKALAFTKTHLDLMVTNLSSPLADQVTRALKWPVRRGLPRNEARHFISFYQQDGAHNEVLLKLAKLDFNLVQKFHQKELSIITKWWIDLDVKTNLPFTRDRVIECSFWGFGPLPEPQYVFSRKIVSKVVAILSIMDDIYDVHGTIEELELFTKVVERWDVRMKDELPDYMKLCFQAVLDLYDEIEEETTKEGRSFCIPYIQEAMKRQVRAYITEARWFNKDHVPTLEEYMKVATVSSIYPLFTAVSFCGMGELAPKEVFDWVLSEPKALYVAASLARLIDDIRSHEFEQARGHVASAVECYMKQHGVSKEEAYSGLNDIVANLWKDLNEELLKPIDVPMPLLTAILNFVRVMDVVYKDEDTYTHSKIVLKEILTALMVDPIAI